MKSPGTQRKLAPRRWTPGIVRVCGTDAWYERPIPLPSPSPPPWETLGEYRKRLNYARFDYMLNLTERVEFSLCRMSVSYREGVSWVDFWIAKKGVQRDVSEQVKREYAWLLTLPHYEPGGLFLREGMGSYE